MVLKSFYIKHTTLITNILPSNKHYLTLTKRSNQFDRAYKLCNIFASTIRQQLTCHHSKCHNTGCSPTWQ